MPTGTMKDVLTGKNGALLALAGEDRDIAAALEEFGPPPDRTLEPGFATLARIIIGQQISTKAAASVWARMVEAGLDHSASAAKAKDGAFRDAGLSARKAEYVKGLAEAVESGTLDLDALARMPGRRRAGNSWLCAASGHGRRIITGFLSCLIWTHGRIMIWHFRRE